MGGTPALSGWDFACPDWFERLKSGRVPMPELPLDAEAAERAVAIFDRLRLPDVPGQPTMAAAAGDWFRATLRAAFGSLDPATGIRRVPEIFLLVPKKNAKTTNGAALMLIALLLNKRPNAELLFVGPTIDVADLAFAQATGMIGADPDGFLQKRFHIREHVKTIVDRLTKAKLKIKTFDVGVLTGAKPVIVLVDELHVMSKFSYASRVIGQIRGGLIPNKESLLLFITTQSDEPPAGAFKAELGYARAVRDGRIGGPDVRVLPILYEFPEAMQIDPERPWADPANWPLVLPNLGRSITLDRLKADWGAAQQKGEEEIRRWASQHLNVEIGLALHDGRWRGADHWLAAAEKGLTLDSLIERAEVATVGIDGGGLDDLMALAVIGRTPAGEWLLWVRAWAQREVLKLRKDIAERLTDFERDGDLVLCDQPAQDVAEIAALVAKVHQAALLPQRFGVGLDPVGISATIDALATHGIETEANGGPVCAVPQGYRLSASVWGMERKLKDRTLRHGGQPLLTWAVGNARTELKGNAVLVTKQVAGKAKIDPLIAAFNAFALMSRSPNGRKSIYETRGVLAA